MIPAIIIQMINGTPAFDNNAEVYAPIPKKAIIPILSMPEYPKEICNAKATIM